jgi:UDP-2,3-diacylglucosamine hydrolase
VAILFISDLHLESKRADIQQAFCRFIQQQASSAEALYILGDLFEVWIGDDNLTDFNLSIIHQLKQLSDSGVPIYLMVGNRDFLLGEQFAELSGCQLLTDPTKVDLYGEPVLLMHGDTLCTKDLDYQKFRAQVRRPEWRTNFLKMSIASRELIASKARDVSQATTQQQAAEIMDVTPEAVTQVMAEQGVQLLIHGHTHRPKVHKLQVRQQAAKRIVLGAWHHQGWVLEVSPTNYNLKHFDL